MLDPQHFWTLVLLVFGLASAASFVLLGWDKRAAARSGRRIPERVLHLLELFGGWPGALIGMALWKHKRRKKAYVAVTAAIVALHAVVWLWLLGAFG